MNFLLSGSIRRLAPLVLTVASMAPSAGCGDSSGEGGAGGEGGSPSFTPLFVSGTRLRARVADAGDGAVQFQGWYDSALEVDCSFQIASDGENRCVPNASYYVRYGDAACTERVVAVYDDPCATGVGDYAIEYSQDDLPGDCDFSSSVSIWNVGASLGTGSAYDRTLEGCVASGEELQLYAVTEEVAADVFAKEAATSFEEHGDLATVVLETEDGAKHVIGLRDVAREAQCYGLDYYDDTTPCAPAAAGYVYEGQYSGPLFTDSACTKPTCYVSECDEPAVIFRYFREGECTDFEVTIHELGARIDQVYGAGDEVGSCVEDLSAAFSHALGAEVQASALPSLTTSLLGTGRLRMRGRAASDGALVENGGLFDFEQEDFCSLHWFSSSDPDTAYCLPMNVGYAGSGLFADASCTEPLVQYEPGECGTPAPVLALEPDPAEMCTGASLALRQVGAELTASMVYVGDPTTCSPVATVDLLGANGKLFRVGGEVPFDTYPAVTFRTE